MKMTQATQALLKDKAYINGQWHDANDKAVFAVYNPATGEKITQVPNMGADETAKAIAAAAQAFPAWRALLAKERSKILKKWHQLIVDNVETLALLLTTEQGKPLAEARAEILGGSNSVEWFAEEAKRIYGDTIPTHKADARIIVTREPIGVVGAVTPWNFPSAMITRKISPALAVGCTIVLKPAEDTPLSALALAALAEQAGFPPGVINIVTGDRKAAATIGKTLTSDPAVRKISFTGSTEVGKTLMRQSADTVKKISLELGGNAPFIVFESADLDKAVDGAIISKFRNAGQTCICANRIFVQDSVYDDFASRLVERVKKMKIGAGIEDGVVIGPLINERGVEKVRRHVEDAVKKGAKILFGGKTLERGPLFFEPTVLRDMTDAMAIKEEETFGPVAGLFRFRTEEEAVRMANDTQYGLAAYFYTRDLAQAFRVSERLEYGMVGINEALLATEVAPFGGVKESGIGRENSKYGIEDYTELKYSLVGGIQ